MKTLLRTTLFVCMLSAVGAAQAAAAHLAGDMYFKGTMNMYDKTGKQVMNDPDITGTMTMDMYTMGGIATMSSPNPFFGENWTVDNIKVSMHMVDMTADMSMMMHWNGNDFPVRMTMKMGMDLLKSVWVLMSTVDADKNGIPGTAMTVGPMVGFSPAMTGQAKMTGMRFINPGIPNPNLTH
jgi:hypothetical protein